MHTSPPLILPGPLFILFDKHFTAHLCKVFHFHLYAFQNFVNKVDELLDQTLKVKLFSQFFKLHKSQNKIEALIILSSSENEPVCFIFISRH